MRILLPHCVLAPLHIITLSAFVATSACFPDPSILDDRDDRERSDTPSAQDTDAEAPPDLGPPDIGPDELTPPEVGPDELTPPEVGPDDADQPDLDTTAEDTPHEDGAEGDVVHDDADTGEDIGPTLNACGGLGAVLPGEPHTPCGACEDGLLVCDPTDPALSRTVCIGATPDNPCGGCEPLFGTIGDPCEPCGAWICDPDDPDALFCELPIGGCPQPVRCAELGCETLGRICVDGGDEDASCGACLGSHAPVGGSCLPVPTAPQGLEASSDRTGEVALQWSAAEHADAYTVLRCPGAACDPTNQALWQTLTDPPISATSWSDTTATAGAPPPAPSPSATDTDPTAITLSWSAVTAPAAPSYSYRVVPVGAAGQGPSSSVVVGRRGSDPVTGYEVRIDSGDWQAAGEAGASSWRDESAPAPMVTPGVASASLGLHPTHVTLSLSGASVTPGATRSYALRARTETGPGQVSPSVQGRRAAATLSVQWQRSAGPQPADFSPITGATTTVHQDTDAPQSGAVRYYRAEVRATGATSALTEAVPGSRQPPPGVPGNVRATTELTDRVTVSWAAVSDAIGYHVYLGQTRLTSGNGITTTSFDDFNAPAPAARWPSPERLSATSDLTAGVELSFVPPARPIGAERRYRVRAVNPAGDGELSEEAVGHRAGPGLAGFEVSTGGGAWVSIGLPDVDGDGRIRWLDSSAPAPTIDAGSLTASQGSLADGVVLSLEGAEGQDGAPRTYTIRARDSAGGAGDPSGQATGRRVPGSLQLTWERSTGPEATSFAQLTTGTSFTHLDTTAPGGTPGAPAVRWYRVRIQAAGASAATTAPAEGWRMPLPGAVPGLSATTNRSDAVAISWSPLSGVDGYLVYRGTTPITPTPLPADRTTFEDAGAGEAGPWPAPAAPNATTSSSSGIQVSWSAPLAPRGTAHSYRVVGVNARGEGDLGSGATGWRIHPRALSGYAVQPSNNALVGGEPGWVSVGATTSWTHGLTGSSPTPAPRPTIQTGAWSASQGEFKHVVRLSHPGGTVQQAAAVTYRVRPLFDDGSAGEPSQASGLGRVAAGGLSREWQRGNSASGPWTAIGSNQSHDDSGAPVDGTKRHYRLRLTAAGATQVVSGAREGWRFAAVTVSRSITHGCALGRHGVVFCWGRNDKGQAGQPASGSILYPTPITGLEDVTHISVGGSHSCARYSKDGGSLRCWGNNEHGQLGDGTTQNSHDPLDLTSLQGLVAPMPPATGGSHTCALTTNGWVRCWGLNENGQLGDGSASTRLEPTLVMAGATVFLNAVQLSAGVDHTCALRTTGKVACWGGNNRGQAGAGGFEDELHPREVKEIDAPIDFAGVRAGPFFTCGWEHNGKVHCWGHNNRYQLGLGHNNNAEFPTLVPGLDGHMAVDVALIVQAVIVTTTTGASLGWGLQGVDKHFLGISDTSDIIFSPTPAPTFTTPLPTVIGSGCAVRNHSVWCWGPNDDGQVGDGTTETRPTPVEVLWD